MRYLKTAWALLLLALGVAAIVNAISKGGAGVGTLVGVLCFFLGLHHLA